MLEKEAETRDATIAQVRIHFDWFQNGWLIFSFLLPGQDGTGRVGEGFEPRGVSAA
jgi:hypothetical protein